MSAGHQVGITRLPARRTTNEPRESMNCKSCRKRKIKCNRLRPTCEACQVFACPCIYDAVPKKRGPKTDVLEALLKRVDGLEKRLHTENKSSASPEQKEPTQDQPATDTPDESAQSQMRVEIPPPNMTVAGQLLSPQEPSQPTPMFGPDVLLDTYFQRIHGKPYYIVDEGTTRQRMQSNQLPPALAFAIYAVSARYASHLSGGYNNAMRISSEYARRARLEIDIEEPSIEALQTLLLLTQASHQSGRGKKTYMLLSSSISMAYALSLHREPPHSLKVSPAEREGRRRLFWACYLMDRFSACGSKRPSLISDEALVLRMPSWQPHPNAMVLEGDYFPSGSNLQYLAGSGKLNQGSTGMLIGIVRILGITNRYLAAGGVKGDSHFPWHALSNLSKIRSDLDIWASETQDTFSSLEALFGQSDSTIIVLSKLIYHLIHCLIYRPFLPVDLAELSGTSQHQSWQIEATNLCFLHANAIAELVEIGRASSILDWPAFVGYCVCTAGTIHVHGAHYAGREGEVFSASAEFLSRELNQLTELTLVWASAQHQRDTLQAIYGCHSELVKSLSSNPMRFSPVFQLEDFFDRYPGQDFDGAHVTFQDVMMEAIPECFSPYIDQRTNPYFSPTIPYPNQLNPNMSPTIFQPSQSFGVVPQQPLSPHHPRKKRRSTMPANDHRPPDLMPHHGEPSKHQNMHLAVPADLPTGLTPPSFSPTFHFTPIPMASAIAPPPTDPSNLTSHPSTVHSFGQSQTNNQTQTHTPDSSTLALGPSDTLLQYDQQPTPGAVSTSGSTHTDPEKDPFLSLLEQLAEGDAGGHGTGGLDFFLGQAGPDDGMEDVGEGLQGVGGEDMGMG